MGLITINEFKLYHDQRLLVKLSADDGTVDYNDDTEANDTVLQTLIDDASYEVSNALRNVYTDVEINSTRTQEIKGITAHLAWCILWERIGNETDQVTQLRIRTNNRLDDLQRRGANRVRDSKAVAKRGSQR